MTIFTQGEDDLLKCSQCGQSIVRYFRSPDAKDTDYYIAVSSIIF